ncbi:MAG: heavy metal-binding domain-containing protein [Bacteroidota bacterium]|jgi:hypothetical protein
MKNRLMFTVPVLILLMMTNASVSSGQDTMAQTCSGCCGGKDAAMAMMRDHSMQKHGHASKDTAAQKDGMKMHAVYSCPMHPAVTSSTPGTCPQCGMELKKGKMKIMHDSTRHEKMMGKLSPEAREKMKLMMTGKYNCCIEDPCDMCVDEGGCSCKNAVKNDKPVCKECYEGWQHGKGDVSGKSPNDIKKENNHEH